MSDDNLSQHSQKGRKTFLIKKKVPEDQLKATRNLQSLPGMSNYLIAPNASQLNSMKPQSRDDLRRKEGSRSKFLNTSASQKVQRQSDVFDQSQQLTEIGERSQLEEEERKNIIAGPQLMIKREFLAFMTKTGTVGYENVVAWNNGSAAIYYEWKRMDSVRQQPNSIQDIVEERFFCHHEQNVIKPGERIKFVFSFLSKVTGIFNEEWELKCEPPCTNEIPTLKLTGSAYLNDQLTDHRKIFHEEIRKNFSLKVATEVIEDVFEEVKTPPPSKPDLEDPAQFKIEFEELNLQEQLWYLPEYKTFFKNVQEEISQQHQHFDWNGDVKELRSQLQLVEDDTEKEMIERKLEMWVKMAKRTPITRNPLYPVVNQLLGELVNLVPIYSEEQRRELAMWEYTFKEPSNEDLTPEQTKAKNDEYNKMKQEWLKKAKKKKWNEELEKEQVEEYRTKLGEKVSNALGELAITIENDGQLLSVGALMNPEWKWDVFRRRRYDNGYWDELLRKKTISDVDIEGKKVALKFHLKLADRPDVQELKQQFEEMLIQEKEAEDKRIEEERIEREKQAQEAAKKKGKGKPAQKQKQQEEEVIVDKPKEWDLRHLDQQNLQECVEIARHLIERQSKVVVLIVSYDQPIGQFSLTQSLRFFSEWLKQQLECPVYFNDAIIENMDELLENQTFQENSVVVLENVFFYQDETGVFTEEPDIESKTPYRTLLPYGQVYIQGDRSNFFSKTYPSIVHLKGDQTILSNAIAKDIHTMAYTLQSDKQSTIIIGGEVTGDKLLTIDQLAGHVSSIILLGQVGLAFYVTMYDIQSDLISNAVRNVIKNLLKTLQQEAAVKPPQRLTRISHLKEQPKPHSRLICPQDYLITLLPEEYDPSNEEHVQTVINSVTPYVPEGNLTLEPGYILLDYGPKTIELVSEEIQQAQRLVWIDDSNLNLHKIDKTITVPDFEAIALLKKLKEEEAQRELERQEKLKEKKGGKGLKKQVKEEAPKEEINIKTTKEINVTVFNETNRTLGKLVYDMQQAKKIRHQQGLRDPGYNFDQDCVVTMIGSRLEKAMNQEDFQQDENELALPSQKDSQLAVEQQEEDEQIDAEAEEAEEVEEVEEKVKINQVRQLLSDFFIQDQEFILQLLAGNQIHCFHFEEYPPKPESEIDEEQYFEDDDTTP